MACVVTLAVATLWELEINANGLALSVSEMSEFVMGAKSCLSVLEHLLMAISHVWVGVAKADNAEGERLVQGTGAKGMTGPRGRPSVQVQLGWWGITTVR